MKRSAVALCASSDHLRRGRRKSSTIPVKGRGKLFPSHTYITVTPHNYFASHRVITSISVLFSAVNVLDSVDGSAKHKVSGQRLVVSASSPQGKTKTIGKKKRGSNS